MEENIENVLNEVKSCQKCSTIIGYKKFPKASHGKTDSEFMLVSEAPGKKSIDKENESEIKYWIGTGGKLLRSTLMKANEELEEVKTNNSKDALTNKELEDIFYLTDIVKCWPNKKDENNILKNRKPNDLELTNCSPFLKREIETLKPKLILSFGEPSTKYLLNQNINMENAHGKVFSYNNLTKVLVMYHPSNIDLHMKRTLYISQLKNVFKKIIENKIEDIEKEFNVSMSDEITPKEEVKSKEVINKSNLFKGISFILPAPGNEITQSDISQNQLRITVDFKNHFPNKNSDLKFTHNGIKYNVKFTHRGKRSHILKLGSTLMKLLELSPNSSVRLTKINTTEFVIEKISKS